MASPALALPRVLELLADGRWHSGVELGDALAVSRAAIWKQVRALRTLGLTVVTERRRGYRLERPLDLLSAAAIRSGLVPATRQALESLAVLIVTTSTNEYLARQPTPPPGKFRAAVAEYQTGGRGRRGRRWLSPPGHGVCLSLSWCFESAPRDLPALSLVAGVAVVDGLRQQGVTGVQLKWPNDVMANGGKAGGILVDVAGESGGPLRVVIGIGLNVRPIPGITTLLRQEGGDARAVALDELAAGRSLERSALVAALLNALHGRLRTFVQGGLPGALSAWREHDYLSGRPVVITSGVETLQGVAHGISADGALLVEAEGRIQPVVVGDVTLRAPA